ncbi:RidA family protein [uncultured Roseibium sp.]|uniref:RidA family protein n=1 Tax=uncultured Roseibium sp. TaxID=1936171 RepID=UPI003217605D
MGVIDERMEQLGLVLPPPWTPRGRFAPFRRDGNLVVLSGQICEWEGRVTLAGPVGSDEVSAERAREEARVCALNLLYCLKLACDGDLDRVSGILRLGGFVNCVSGFDRSPFVIDGATDVFVDVFGDSGVHARTAVGVCGLPGNAAVEVDAMVALKPA